MWSGQDSWSGIYIALSNLDSKANYPSNTWCNFQVDLPKDLDLISYKVALCEINITDGNNLDDKYLTVCCNIAQPTWRMGKWLNSIRSLSLSGSNKTFTRLEYINCVQTKFTSIHIYITDLKSGESLESHNQNTVTEVTLHILRQGDQIDMANLKLKSTVDEWKKHFRNMISARDKTGIVVAKATSLGQGISGLGNLDLRKWGTSVSRPVSSRKRRATSQAGGSRPAKRRRKTATKSKTKPKRKTTTKKKKSKTAPKKKKTTAKKRKSTAKGKKKKTKKSLI